MGLTFLFEVFEFILLALSAYWGLEVALETLTYIKLRGPLILLPILLALTFRATGLLATFALLLLFFLAERNGVGLSVVASLFAITIFLMGAIASGIFLGIVGTALHVPGYEIHGTLDELFHRAVMKNLQ